MPVWRSPEIPHAPGVTFAPDKLHCVEIVDLRFSGGLTVVLLKAVPANRTA